MKYLIPTCLALFMMTACGGGGGGTSTPAATVTEEPAPVVVTPQTPEEPAEGITLSRVTPLDTSAGSVQVDVDDLGGSVDIVVPDGFKLDTEQAFNLSVNHPHENAKAYLSVCTDFSVNSDDSFEINYDSCMMRASVDGSEYETEIVVTNDVEKLVAALWFLDTSIDPMFAEWTLDESVQ